MKLLKSFLNYPQVFCQLVLILGVILLLLGVSLVNGHMLADCILAVNTFIVNAFGGLYLWFALILLAVFFMLIMTPLGKIRLGGPNAKPEHDTFSWIAMLLCSGTGIGVMFWGAAEPLFHFMNPPYAGVQTVAERTQTAFNFAYMHWGLIPYALFSFTGLLLGYWGYNLKRGFCFSTFFTKPFEPTFKNIPKTILYSAPDLITTLAIGFGMATTLGLGVLQAEGGLHRLLHWPTGPLTEITILVTISAVFIGAVWLGLEKGIKTLAHISIALSFCLLGMFILVGPRAEMMDIFWHVLPGHLLHLKDMGLGIGNYQDPMWINHWTIKTWSWTITWAPFVGLFIALISKGRTMRELFWGATVVPAVFSCFWFTVFGQMAIHEQLHQHIMGSTLNFGNTSEVLFRVLESFPYPTAVSVLSLVIIVIFISHSADSASYTMTYFNYHKIAPEHSRVLQVTWGAVFSVICGLLVLSGGLTSLQEITQIAALPFTIMLTLVFFRVFYELLRENTAWGRKKPDVSEEIPVLDTASLAGNALS